MNDETGTFSSGGSNGGGATLNSFDFPAGTFPTVDLDGGHYTNNAGFAYDNDELTSFTTNDDLAIYVVTIPGDQASRLLVTNFSGGSGYGFGISDGVANSMKFWTSGPSLETGVADYTPGEPITVAATWEGLGEGKGSKKTWVRGVEIAEHTVDQPGYNGNNDFRIGSGQGLVQDWTGHLAEIVVYDDASVRTDVEGYFRAKYFAAPVPGTPLMHLDAGGTGVVSSGGVVSDWNDETGTFSSGGSNGGGATVSSFAFPTGTFPTVDLDGGHYTNNAGFQYDNDDLFKFDENSDLAIFAMIIPRSHQSSQIVLSLIHI